jgi:hypothetical protein
LYLRRGRLVGDGPIDEILQQYTTDRETEGHPGWKGERKKARRQRRRRKLEAKQLAAAGLAPPPDLDLDEEDEGIPETEAPTKLSG